jgi:acetolactate synthase-1/2/3 large subunit
MSMNHGIRVSDYIVNRLSSQGIDHVFMVTGGASMHLSDAFGRVSKIKKAFCHHEQYYALVA